MASDDTMTVHSSMQEEDDDEMDDHHHHRYNMSRLSICTSNSKESICDDVNDDMILNMSSLSVEDGSEVEADGELSDGKEVSVGFEDSDRETGWLSLPASPNRRVQLGSERRKDPYGSENESCRERRRRRRSMMLRRRSLERAWEMRKDKSSMEEENPSGESECVVMARPKGGRRSICMDMGEIKACRDLGLDLQREWTLEIPNRISGSTSTMDTDSGGNSPIASWRIFSPGDDPRDVKARLKVWAQAVALASASRLSG
ncbi:hypothetical protein MRB53_032115 [Persea americana]|uniref:Uncharacterized protein n=1 Tax=Persea americana TaxID=3435 RepID=A0ACC2KRY9_PERAE|nr:hypothetical protein MRB53_032115 [Persea americana]|eukprot:TRINITY_DN8934_c3_g1_i1.p2 TRINITY_DN8934_c3_g1~~TRINITY_DN8934_c3_g1_i1.p2  ORF type:complete len:259 (+),score=62.10 TRINITY_DN8934_c3_g1_i1:151-927(+)